MAAESKQAMSHAVRGAAYMAMGVGVAKILSVATLFVFARFLDPSQYGIVTLAYVILGLLAPVRDFGLNQAAIYFRSEDSLRFAATIRIGSSLAIFGILAAAMFVRPQWFGGSDAVPVVAIILSSILVSSITFSSEVRLSRAVRFKEIVIAEAVRTGAYAIGSAALVVAGLGILGVAIAYLGAAVFRAVVLHSYERIALSPTMKIAERSVVLRYGAAVTTSGLAVLLITNLDSLLVAALFGTSALGVYGMAWNWTTLVALQGAFVLHQVLFPTFVLVKDDREGLRMGTLRALSLSLLFALPVSLCLGVSGFQFVTLFLGPSWVDAAPLIGPFCLYAAARATVEPFPSSYLALGKPTDLVKYQFVHLAMLVPSALAMSSLWGVLGIAWAVFLTYSIAGALIVRGGLRHLEIPLREPIRVLVAYGLAAGAVAITLATVLTLVDGVGFPHILLLYIAASGAFVILANRASRGLTFRDVRFVIRAVRERSTALPKEAVTDVGSPR